MLEIKRLKVVIRTENGDYGFDEKFSSGLNFIASENNTCGKSSILVAIYYCLGFEEIIGGKGEKVLTSVFKSSIEDGDNVWSVLQSEIYLEIFNGDKTITIYRSAKMDNRDNKLITVYYSGIDEININSTKREDMYVHMPNAAVNEKGFHTFLEKYIGFKLPLVSTSDDSERKLYLQLVFSCMFIEQKRGWADILSGLPILGVRDSKKRVLEFILGLDTIDNEKNKHKLNQCEIEIKNNWLMLVQDININCNREDCVILGVPQLPQIVDENLIEDIKIVMNNNNNVDIHQWIDELQVQYNSTRKNKQRVVDNFDELQIELQEIEKEIKDLEERISNEYSNNLKEKACIKRLVENLEVIRLDIINNKDAARLKDLGSKVNCFTAKEICPVCNQVIEDTLLLNDNSYEVMSIDENIRHLTAQKQMFEYALESHKNNKKKIENKIKDFESVLFKLRRLARSIRNDLYSVDDTLSETLIRKRLEVANKIESLKKLQEEIFLKLENLKKLSSEWKDYLIKKEGLPKDKFSEKDKVKIKLLESNFIDNLSNYGYKSVSNLDMVKISKENYLPTTQGFDMKFDSSASDNIRAIWAYTMSLMQTSIELGGNHPRILIFDEPDQHSIVISDMEQFFNSIIKYSKECQVIIGITVKDSDTKSAMGKLENGSYKIININTKAFTKNK